MSQYDHFVVQVISTHAPRTGSDIEYDDWDVLETNISTHAPRTGSDLFPSR